MSVEERLAEMGHLLPLTPQPAGGYVPAVHAAGLVFTAGQLPAIEGMIPPQYAGKVDVGVDLETARHAAIICLLNCLAAIKGLIGDLERVERIVKVTGYVASDATFTLQPEVMNPLSELLTAAFDERGPHARSAVGVAVLPRDASVEVELIVALRDPHP